MKKRYLFIFMLLLIFPFLKANALIINDKNTEDYTYSYGFSASRYNEFLNVYTEEDYQIIYDFFKENYGNASYTKFVNMYCENCSSGLDVSRIRFAVLDFTNLKAGVFNSSYRVNGFNKNQITNYNIYSYNSVDKTLTDITNYGLSNYSVSIGTHSTYYAIPFYTNSDLRWKDILTDKISQILTTLHYISDIENLDDKYKENYYLYFPYEFNEYIYTLSDLLGFTKTKPSNKGQTIFNYKINYYFDNVLDIGATEEKIGNLGDVITDFTDYSSDIYYLDYTKEYSLTISSNEENNVLNVFYKSRKKATYKIEYYFDDILKENYTEIKEDFVDTEIINFTDYANDYWKLVENEYKLIINENSDLNILKIYYRSANYGTEYQTIDTKNLKIPFIFHFADIKEYFSGINFDIFTQKEQLEITIFINMWFIAIFSFITWIMLKIIYKVFQIFR